MLLASEEVSKNIMLDTLHKSTGSVSESSEKLLQNRVDTP